MANVLKEKYGTIKIRIRRVVVMVGGGGGVQTKTNLPWGRGGGIDILWNHTFKENIQKRDVTEVNVVVTHKVHLLQKHDCVI